MGQKRPREEEGKEDEAGDTNRTEDLVGKWVEYHDTKLNKSYYYNTAMKVTTWTLPEGAVVSGKPIRVANQKAIVEATYETAEEKRSAEAVTANTARVEASRKQEEEAADKPPKPKAIPLPPNLASLPARLSVYIRHDVPPTLEELARPARKQASMDDVKRTAYMQGSEDYNIWYHRYMTPKVTENGRLERVPAAGHCNVFKDAGYTRADTDPSCATNPCCIYFAKGICTQGHECQYYHRVPTEYENDCMDLMHDVFGRDRHASHRDDMEGAGTFNSPCTTLFVGDYSLNRGGDYLSRIEELLLAHFSIYGPLEDVHVLPNKNFAFVTYCYRAAAEFAKVAMAGWHFDDPKEILTVRWAQGQRGKQSKKTE